MRGGRFLLLFVLAATAVVPVALARNIPPLTGWLSYGNGSARTGFVPQLLIPDPTTLKLVWTTQVDGAVTAQPLVLRDVPNAGDRTLYVATSAGTIWEINQNGYAIAKRTLGHMTLPSCPYFPGNRFGITGTPTVDPASHTLYVGDAAGYVHALDPVTLADKPGWPVRLFRNTKQQLIWGALTLAGGKLYAGTGLLCEAASEHLYSIDLRTRKVKAWSPVPMSLGGGGGIWGWGGVSFDARTRTLLTATGDALPGGTNVGRRFSESAGYAEHLVQLGLDLHVRQAHSPHVYRSYVDQDLTGTPIVMRASGCPALVAVESKNGNVYVWKLGTIGKGVWQAVKVAPKLNGQPAWSPLLRSLYVVGQTQAFRLQLTAGCRFTQAWSIGLAKDGVNGPPLVTGNVIWVAVSSDQALWALDATTGAVLWKGGLGEAGFAPPAIVDGRVYAAGFQGLIAAFG